VINEVWISISDPVEFFQNPVRSGSGSELQNPVGSRSGTGSCSTLVRDHSAGAECTGSLVFWFTWFQPNPQCSNTFIQNWNICFTGDIYFCWTFFSCKCRLTLDFMIGNNFLLLKVSIAFNSFIPPPYRYFSIFSALQWPVGPLVQSFPPSSNL